MQLIHSFYLSFTPSPLSLEADLKFFLSLACLCLPPALSLSLSSIYSPFPVGPHPIPSHTTQSHLVPSHLILSHCSLPHPIPSHPVPSRPIPCHPISPLSGWCCSRCTELCWIPAGEGAALAEFGEILGNAIPRAAQTPSARAALSQQSASDHGHGEFVLTDRTGDKILISLGVKSCHALRCNLSSG